MNNSVIKIAKKDKESIIIDIEQPSHSLPVGAVVYYSKPSGSYGRYKLANAAILETANAVGFVYSVSDSNNFKLITHGLFEHIIFKPYDVGEVIFLGSIAGTVTDTEQVYSKPLGVKTKAGLLVNIQRGSINTSLLNNSLQKNNGFITSSGGASSEVPISQDIHSLLIGDAVYCSDGKYKKALAKEAEEVEVVGIVSSVASNNSFTLLTSGFYRTRLFDKYTDGTVLFLSDVTAGLLINTESGYISKPVATKVEGGIIVNIQRGIVYNVDNEEGSGGTTIYKVEDKIGDIKYSADTTEIRTDGYILFKNGQSHNKEQVLELLNTVSTEFIETHIIVTDTLITFQNTEHLTDTVYYNTEDSSGNLYIKAFNSNNGTLVEVPVGNIMITLDVTPPIYYMHLDGRECTISDYPVLASYVYNTYGSYTYFGGDGILTFGLPHLNTSITDTSGNTIPMYYYIKYC